MTAEIGASTLQRMLKALPKGASQRALADGLRRAIPRNAADKIGLEIRIPDIAERDTKLSAELTDLPDGVMLCGLSGPRGVEGLCFVSFELRTGLIEVLTTGQVSSRQNEMRRATNVDAHLVMTVLGDWMCAMAAYVPDDPAWQLTPSVSYPDIRTLELALEDAPFRKIALTLKLADGARRGDLILLLPPLRLGGHQKAFSDALYAALAPVEIDLHIIAARQKTTLGAISNLDVGDEIRLEAFDTLNAGMEQPLGHRHGCVQVGQSKGKRAVRLVVPPSETLEEPLSGGLISNASPPLPEVQHATGIEDMVDPV